MIAVLEKLVNKYIGVIIIDDGKHTLYGSTWTKKTGECHIGLTGIISFTKWNISEERAFMNCRMLKYITGVCPILGVDMSYMFCWASNFNQPLNDWDVSSVTNMKCMFWQASSFNQPLDDWDVSLVTNMRHMFYKASNFNQPLNDWDVSSVTDMESMFRVASNFNQPLDDWDVSSVTYMRWMFEWTKMSKISQLPEWLH